MKFFFAIRRKYILALFVSVIFCLFIFLGFVMITRADTVNFYPAACLGGWTNTYLAQGQPDVSGNSEFSLKNSALSENNSISQIFCGGFRGDIIKNTEVKKIILHFSWALTDTKPAEEIPVTITSSNFSSSADQIINIPENSDSKFILQPKIVSSSSTNSGVDINTEELSPAPQIEQPIIEPETIIDSSTSFLLLFTKKAYAEDQILSSTSADVITHNSDATSSDQTLSQTASVIESANNKESLGNSTDEPFLEVKYTIDGIHWKSLGQVTRNNFSNLNFELPVSDFASWGDLSQLQISVERIATINIAPTIYMDSMWLEIAYDKTVAVNIPDTDLTEKLLHFTPGLTTNSILTYLVKVSNDKKETLSIGVNDGGSLKIYGVTDPGFNMVIGVGGEQVEFSGYSFPPGKYFLIYTKQADACSGMSLYQCASDSDFLDKLDFSVTLMPNIKTGVVE